jgi:uncharacterized protein
MSAAGDEIRVHPIGVYEQQGESEEDVRPPVLLLRDDLGREVRLPIGSCEGLAIQFVLVQTHVPRPLTHDLALHLLAKLSGRLEHVVIDRYSEQEGCHATLEFATEQGPRSLEARAGDGVALALRADLPVYVTEEVLLRAGGG